MLKTREKRLVTILLITVGISSVAMVALWFSNHQEVLRRRFERALGPTGGAAPGQSKDNSSLRIKRKGGIIRLKLPSLVSIFRGFVRVPCLTPPLRSWGHLGQTRSGGLDFFLSLTPRKKGWGNPPKGGGTDLFWGSLLVIACSWGFCPPS